MCHHHLGDQHNERQYKRMNARHIAAKLAQKEPHRKASRTIVRGMMLALYSVLCVNRSKPGPQFEHPEYVANDSRVTYFLIE